jgi:nickel/cobalt transporter (NiCoT) family protein
MTVDAVRAASAGDPAVGGRLARVRAALTPQEWSRAAALAVAVIGLHVVGFGLLVFTVAPHHYLTSDGKAFGIGIGITAYVLGMRHAFDADHIAAIDNTTRKFLAEGKRSLSTGFWFSLGHSSVVFFAAALLALGVKSFAGEVSNGSSGLHRVTGVVGASVSGTFLLLIAGVNVVILYGILKVFRDMRRGHYDEATLENHLNSRGLMNRILGRATRAIRQPWQMYPLGFLFGLGFDTATEIALLFIAGSAASSGLPWWAILTLPILFAAGMSLWDTIDGSFMNFAYGWAFSQPVRKVYYNIAITGLSVAVAVVIGGIELVGVLADEFKWNGRVVGWIAGLDLNVVGYFVVALFAVTWIVAMLVWRLGRIEEKWTSALQAD